MKRAGMVLIGACVMLASCGGGSDDSDAVVASATDPPATSLRSTASTMVEAVTSTDTPPASTTATTTSTTTSTTLAPTTTLSEEQAAIAAAEAALVDAFEARTAALTDPADPELRDRVAKLWTEPSLSAVMAQLDRFAADGMVVRRSTDRASFVEVVGESDIEGTDRVAVTYCRLDSDAIVMAESLGDLEVVVDDDVATRIWRGVLLREGGMWRLSGADVVVEVDGQAACDDLQP